MQTVKIPVTTTGSAGAATGTGRSARAFSGEVLALFVDWSASAPVTSDIDIVCESDDDHPDVTLYDKDNANTDVWLYPAAQETVAAGTGTGTYRPIPISGRIKVTVGGCDALDSAVTVYAWVR